MRKILITLYLFLLTTAPLPGINIPLFTICSFLIIGYFLLHLLTNKNVIVDKNVVLLFLSFLVVIVISTIFAPDYVPLPGQLSFYLKVVFLSLWGIATFDLICRIEARQIYLIYYKSVFIISSIGILLFLLHLLGINNSIGIYTEFYIPRLQAFSQEPQGFAGMALLCIAIWHYYRTILFKHTAVMYISILVIAVAIVLTFSPVPILLMSLYAIYSFTKKGLAATFIILTVLTIVIIYNIDFFPYYFNLKFGANAIEASGSTRLHFWTVAWREFLEHPFSGVGPEGYGYYYNYFKLGLRDVEVYPQPPQNLVLGILANFGAVGGLYFLTFFIAPVLILWFRNAHLDTESKTAIVLWLLVILLNMQIWNVTSQTLWFFLLLLYSRFYFLRQNRLGLYDLPHEQIQVLRSVRIKLGLTPVRLRLDLPRFRFRLFSKNSSTL